MLNSAKKPCLFAIVICLACVADVAPSLKKAPIEVLDSAMGCELATDSAHDHSRHELRYRWDPVPGGYSLEGRFVSDSAIAHLRAIMLDHQSSEDKMLNSLGISAASIMRHREEILHTALELDKPKTLAPMPSLPTEYEVFLSFEYLAPHIRDEMLGRNWVSTSRRRLEIIFPGQPTIIVTSQSLVPLMLPWKVSVEAETWVAADPRISLELVPLVLPEGNCAGTLNGEEYWTERFWRDERFWKRFVGNHLVNYSGR